MAGVPWWSLAVRIVTALAEGTPIDDDVLRGARDPGGGHVLVHLALDGSLRSTTP
jgi:hypothetical protein